MIGKKAEIRGNAENFRVWWYENAVRNKGNLCYTATKEYIWMSTQRIHEHWQSCQPVTFKKSIIEIKKPYFEVKKSIFARGERITSAKSFRPGSRDLRALEAHGF